MVSHTILNHYKMSYNQQSTVVWNGYEVDANVTFRKPRRSYEQRRQDNRDIEWGVDLGPQW
jgi:hypothetical protein